MVVNSVFQVLWRNPARTVHGQARYPKTVVLQPICGSQYCVMLYCRNNNMIAFVPVVQSNAFQRPVVRLRTAGRKIQFVRFATYQTCNGLAGVGNCLCRISAEVMLTVGIAVFICKIRKHRFDNPFVAGRCRRVVNINSHLSKLLNYKSSSASCCNEIVSK